ncbi:MAG: exopolysaccharide biosynthesis polyprenyl glycosylphosphotransferase [Verrucomicrobiota bacterium]
MISYRIAGISRIHLILQLGALGGLFWGILAILSTVIYKDGFDWSAYRTYLMVLGASLVVEALTRRPGANVLLDRDPGSTVRATLRQIVVLALGLSVFLVLKQDTTINRPFFVLFTACYALVLYLSNRFLPPYLAKVYYGRHNRHQIKTVLLGTPQQVEAFSKSVVKPASLGLDILGYVTDGIDTPTESSRWKHLGSRNVLQQNLAKRNVEKLILLGLPDDLSDVKPLVSMSESHGVRFLLVNDLDLRLGRPVVNKEVKGMNFMVLHNEPLEDPLNRVLKRALDIVFSAAMLVTVLPWATLFVWALHRLQSPGPLFYSQSRSGWRGRPFKLYKFRSLYHRDHDEAEQVSEGDPRVFSGGRFIRKFSIDELPQFWNVLRGDMSLVGPRPHLREQEDGFEQVIGNYWVRSFVKPGITGLAQVKGFRGATPTDSLIQERVNWDIRYLENWSLTMDLRILIGTLLQVLRPPKSAM